MHGHVLPLRPRVLLACVPALGLVVMVGTGTAAAAHAPANNRAATIEHLLGSLHPTHHAMGGQAIRGTGLKQAESPNWSGYADDNSTGSSYTEVSGSWTEPTGICAGSTESAVAFSVGIDGFNNNTVEQAGTLILCPGGSLSTPEYATWWETYPSSGVQVVGTTVAAGDEISASVVRSGTSYTLAVTDSTTPANSFTTTQTCSASTCADQSAEWIAEAAPTTSGELPLTDFGSWTLTGATVAASCTTGTISSFPDDEITMEDSSGNVLAQPGPLNSTGNQFTVAWQNATVAKAARSGHRDRLIWPRVSQAATLRTWPGAGPGLGGRRMPWVKPGLLHTARAGRGQAGLEAGGRSAGALLSLFSAGHSQRLAGGSRKEQAADKCPPLATSGPTTAEAQAGPGSFMSLTWVASGGQPDKKITMEVVLPEGKALPETVKIKKENGEVVVSGRWSKPGDTYTFDIKATQEGTKPSKSLSVTVNVTGPPAKGAIGVSGPTAATIVLGAERTSLDWAAILGGGEKPTKNYGWKFVDKDGKAASLPPGVNTGPHGSDNGLFNIFGTWKPDKEEIEKGWMAFLEITQGSATPVRTPLTVTFEQPPK